MGSSAPPPAGTVGLTYADLQELPLPGEAGGSRYELLDGELLVTPAPVIRHQRGVGQVYGRPAGPHTRVRWSCPGLAHRRVVLGPDGLRARRAGDRRSPPRPGPVAGVLEFWCVDLDADQVHVHRLGGDGTCGPPTVVLEDGMLDAVAWPELRLPAREALVIEE